MKKRINILIGLLSVALVGCSTTRKPEVAMKIDDNVAHVSFAPDTLKTGDKIKIVREQCAVPPTTLRSRNKPGCKETMLGKGYLVEVLNDHYGVAKLDAPVQFKEGDKVLKDIELAK